MPPSWTDIAQAVSGILTIFVAIGGFVFVYYQIRQVERQMRGETHGKIFSHYSEIIKTLRENQKLRPYFHEGISTDKNDPLDNEVHLVAEMFVDFFEHLAVQIENLPKDSVDCWEKTAVWRFDNSPAIRLFLSENKQLYAPVIFQMLERGRQKMS